MDKIIEKFLQLTQYTYIHGEEQQLEKFLPDNLQKDEVGNYFIEIGESETMFCSHLDTAAFEKEKVTHDFFKNDKGHLFVGTTGETVKYSYIDSSGQTITKERVDSTLLGADDKAGVVILLNMIENNIPGLYYFFLGEEVGAIGSKAIVRRNSAKFEKYKRCIAFDRRAYGSIISKQMGRTCCSDEFVESLSNEFKRNGMKYQDDKTGIFTDSASFMDIIPECTNLSVGYFNEHSNNEVQNLTYLIKLAKTVLGINWESLATSRNPVPYRTPKPTRYTKTSLDLTDDELEDLFVDVDDIIEKYTNYKCANWNDFIPERQMIYVDRKTDDIVTVYIHESGYITIDNSHFATLSELVDEFETYYDKYKNRFKEEENEDKYCEICGDDLTKNGYCPTCKTNTSTNNKGNKSNKSNKGNKDDKKMKSGIKSDFEKNIDIQDFIFDVASYCTDNSSYVITVNEMNNILDSYNKSIESLIYWIYSKDNDPNKTFGLYWDDDLNQFEIRDSI